MSSEVVESNESGMTSQSTASDTLPLPPATPPAAPQTFWGAVGKYLRGDLGQLPVLATLVLIAIFFQITSHGLFFKPENLSNLVLQIATLGTIGLASVFVLLIGEIDLSLGAVAYTCGAVTVVLSSLHGWNAVTSLLAGLVAGALIGLVNGIFVAVLRVPSFIVTLAGLLGYQGLVIHLLFPQTSLIVSDITLQNLATTYLGTVLGVTLPIIAIVLYAGGVIYARLQRQRSKLAVTPAWTMWVRIGVVVVVAVASIILFESYFGVPQSTMILVGLVLLFWLIMRFTRFGRHVYAVGGNAEAARRAGINVTGVRIVIFVLASTLAAVGGILLASRQGVASSDVDQTLLLNAIATAVIGGVSLFGGRGSVWSVVLGSLVIGSLANGLALLNQNTDVIYMVEGVVLIIAVTADALVRRRSLVTAR